MHDGAQDELRAPWVRGQVEVEWSRGSSRRRCVLHFVFDRGVSALNRVDRATKQRCSPVPRTARRSIGLDVDALVRPGCRVVCRAEWTQIMTSSDAPPPHAIAIVIHLAVRSDVLTISRYIESCLMSRTCPPSPAARATEALLAEHEDGLHGYDITRHSCVPAVADESEAVEPQDGRQPAML